MVPVCTLRSDKSTDAAEPKKGTYRRFTTDRSTVQGYVTKYHANAQVVVYYNPYAPANSVLEPGVGKRACVAGVVVLLVLSCIGFATGQCDW